MIVDSAQHLLILIEYRQGRPLKEPIHAEDIGGGVFRLLQGDLPSRSETLQ